MTMQNTIPGPCYIQSYLGGPRQEFTKYNGGTFTLHMTVPDVSPTDKWIGRRRVYRLNRTFRLRIECAGVNWKIDVPEGFETDLASFPVVLQLLLGNRDDYLEESVVHDWLYKEGIPTFFANATMRVIMECLKRPWWKRWLVFYGLMFLGYRAPLWLKLKGQK